MMVKVFVIIIISILLSGCKKQEVPDVDITTTQQIIDIIAETTTAEQPAKKDISEYKDCTVTVPDSFDKIVENPNIIPIVVSGGSSYSLDTIEELSKHSECVVRGKIVNLTYAEQGEFGGTFYSFAVEEVLKGQGIEAETIVSVLDSQGYVRLKSYREATGSNSYSQYSGEEADRTYIVRTSGEPLVEIGEEYVLFISQIKSTWSGEELNGRYYDVISPYLGKFKANETGLYERFLPEYEKHLYELNEPVTLETIKTVLKESEGKG